MAHKSIDWEEIAAANDKAFNEAFGGEMPVLKELNEMPTFNEDREGYDPLLSGKDKVNELIKFAKYKKEADPDKKKKFLEALSESKEKAFERVKEFRNQALTNAWKVLPDKSPIKQLGANKFHILFECYDPVIMSITDHELDIPHSLIMHEIVYKQSVGEYDEEMEQHNFMQEYWFEKQEKWAKLNDRSYYGKWTLDIRECQKRINRNYLNRKENTTKYYDIISVWWGPIDAVWRENGVWEEVTQKDIKRYLIDSDKYKGWDIDDPRWVDGFKVATKLIPIGRALSRGDDTKPRHRRRKKV